MAHRLNSFIHQSHILPSEQFSFCKQHSAVSHLSRIVNFITHGFNLRKHTGIVLLDITFGLNGLLFKLISLHFLDFLLFLLLGRSYLYCSPERLYLQPKTYALQSTSGCCTIDCTILPLSFWHSTHSPHLLPRWPSPSISVQATWYFILWTQ